MRLPKVSKRSARWKGNNVMPIILLFIVISVGLLFYVVNVRLTPTYLQYAEVQSNKIASLVISKAINSRTSNVLDVNDIIEHVPSDQSNMVTTKFNTEIINRVLADTTKLVQTHLEQAEEGNLDNLPYLDDIEYDTEAMEDQGGIVFFVPIGQATNIPLLGNLGPKIPIRFHVIGSVKSNVISDIREFGINNAYVEVSILITVNVQIIVPLATKITTIKQSIPVAMGLVQGQVPQIYTRGDGSAQPSIEVPIKSPTE
ncbi:MAG: sporulation protein YunB [Paenisporosarcina sp.]